MPNSGEPTLLVVGATSGLAQAYLASDAMKGTSRVILSSRRGWSANTHGAGTDYRTCDVTNIDSLVALITTSSKEAALGGAPLHVLYCCGAWTCGPLDRVPIETLRKLWDVCLTAPAVIAHTLLSQCDEFRFVTTFGMGGSANRIAFNAPYAVGADAARALIEAVGAECTRNVALHRACFGLALGLIDKGQSWLAAGRDKIPPLQDDYSAATAALRYLFYNAPLASSGDIICIPGHYRSYAPLVNYLQEIVDGAPQ